MGDYKDLNVGYKNDTSKQWEVNLNLLPEGGNGDPARSFLPTPGKKRAQPHKKINECDH